MIDDIITKRLKEIGATFYGHVTQEMKEEAARRIQLSIEKRAWG